MTAILVGIIPVIPIAVIMITIAVVPRIGIDVERPFKAKRHDGFSRDIDLSAVSDYGSGCSDGASGYCSDRGSRPAARHGPEHCSDERSTKCKRTDVLLLPFRMHMFRVGSID